MKPITLGALTIDPPIVLAPMAGVTDRPFRMLCRDFGAGLAVAEMISAQPQLKDSRKSRLRRVHEDEPAPRAVQLLGNDPAQMADAARLAVDQGAQIIDINLGCPAKKVCKKAAGSALMAESDTVRRIVEAVVAAVEVPVTLKMRTGLTPEQRNAVDIARIVEDAGIAMLAIHGRSRADLYRGEAEYDTIAAVVDAVTIPVLANGDINSVAKARQVLAQTHAAGIMVGRGALGQPWLFAQLKAALVDKKPWTPPSRKAQVAILQQHVAALHAHYGEVMGVRVARKHAGWYAQTLALQPTWRSTFNALESAEEQLDCINQLIDQLNNQTVIAA